MTNKELLKQTLQHIEKHPQDWDQSDWRCGSAMCFAGWATMLAGGELASDNAHDGYVRAEEGDRLDSVITHPETGKPVVTICERATRVLGLGPTAAFELFDESNTLNDLRGLVQQLTEE